MSSMRVEPDHDWCCPAHAPLPCRCTPTLSESSCVDLFVCSGKKLNDAREAPEETWKNSEPFSTTPHGASEEPILVRAATLDGRFELSVANKGEPIPPYTLERLFQPFFRVVARPSQQGLGLGLYIACEIAKAHGGSLDVTSDQQETRFTFRMPLAHLD